MSTPARPLTKTSVTTKVNTYLFKPNTDIESVLTFLKEKFPDAIISVFEDENGYTSVTTTETATADEDSQDCPDDDATTICSY